jgi:hypothetical protein
MPTYQFRDKKTGKVEEMFMRISEMEEYLSNHPSKEKLLSAPAIVSGVSSGKNKPDNGFRDVLQRIKKNNKGSKINTW